MAPAALLMLVSAWEIVATVRAGGDVGDDRHWAAAADAVRARHEPGDLIVFAPRWADPIGRMHLGDLIPVDMAARMDAAGYARIWEVSVRGERSPERGHDVAHGAARTYANGYFETMTTWLTRQVEP